MAHLHRPPWVFSHIVSPAALPRTGRGGLRGHDVGEPRRAPRSLNSTEGTEHASAPDETRPPLVLRSPAGGPGAPGIPRYGGCQSAPPGRHWRRGEARAAAARREGPMGPREPGPAVLVVEDDPGVAALLAEVLAGAGYAPTTTDSALGAVALARRLRPAVVLLDLGLPYRSGGALLGDLKADPATAGGPRAGRLRPGRRPAPGPAGAGRRRRGKPFGPAALLAAVRGAVARTAPPTAGARPPPAVTPSPHWRQTGVAPSGPPPPRRRQPLARNLFPPSTPPFGGGGSNSRRHLFLSGCPAVRRRLSLAPVNDAEVPR